MLTDSRYTNPDYETIGPARLFLETDEGHLLEVAKLADASLGMDVVNIQQQETHSGVDVPIREFQRGENYSLTLKFAERLSPDLFQMLFGIEPTIEEATIEQITELIRFSGEAARLVGRPYGITDSVVPPTGFTATLFSSGSTIAEGEYYIFLEAVFRGGGRSIAVGIVGNKVDITSAQEKIALEWAHPQISGSDVVPDYYRIYAAASNDPAASELWVEIPGAATSTILSTALDGEAYPGAPAGVSSLKDYETDDTMVPNTDYIFDASKGLIQAVDGEGISSNKAYKFTYYIHRPEQVYFNLGELRSEPTYRKLIIQQVTALDGQEKSARWELEKVNVKGAGISEMLSTTEFTDGVDVTMTPIYDLVTQRVGRKYVDGSIVKEWDIAL